ncbi:DNA mismatch repair protein MutS [Phlebopus sp. FC_14]|nr:DNA mismatch repair protein MutS [Phlebopus sp. FC_14]
MPRQRGLKRPRSSHRSIETDPQDPPDLEKSVETRPKRVRWDGTSDSREGCGNQSDSDAIASTKPSGRIGCAYYEPVRSVVHVLEDTRDDLHHDLTKMLVKQASPDVILTSSKADDTFISILQDHAETSGSIFQIRPHKEFTPSKGRHRLLSLGLLADLAGGDLDPDNLSDISSAVGVGNAYDFMQKRRQAIGDPAVKRWNAAIRSANFVSLESAPLCISSIGVLLNFLAKERVTGELDECEPELNVRGIETLALDKVMSINADALFSLQVFENEHHASIHSDKTKEGLSLFGILNHTRTPLGRSLFRTWFIRPSLSLEVLKGRHDAVECFLRPENLPATGALQVHLKGIANIPRTLGVLRSGKGRVSDWQALVKFTYHSSMLRDTVAELYQGSHVEVLVKLIEVLDAGCFKEVGIAVNETIDWEESAEADRVCVRPHVDEELDKRKHVYRGIDSVLSKVAEQISRTVPADYATSLNVVYFPQLGFLITVPMRDEWQSEEGVQVLEGWSFQASCFRVSARSRFDESFSHVYFKSQEMHDMDSHIGDLHPAIVASDREIEIIQELLDRILAYDKAMGDACDVCAELDCLLSFAEAARAFSYRRPQMVEEPIINIVQGRHPLQEHTVDAFVSNDARLIGGVGIEGPFEADNMPSVARDMDDQTAAWTSIVLCSGANACGKSVYLKQVALIQYMAQVAQSGSFVPAESATLGIVDKIFTRIYTRESVSKVQSAFMIDLNQVSLALRNCTSRSLVLLDEFGKGTVAADGAGLFCGVLKHLLTRGTDCPKVLAASHFHEVFRKDLLEPHKLPITFLHMQVLFTSSEGNVLDTMFPTSDSQSGIGRRSVSDELAAGEKITYLYRVAPGFSLSSSAVQCAAMFGLPRRILARAQYVSELLAVHEVGKLLEEQMTDAERLDLQTADEIARRFLEWDLTSEEAAHQTGVKTRLAEILGRRDNE